MIIALAITAAANIGAAAPSPLYADSLENVFIAACLDGRVNLGEQGAQSIQFDALPKTLKQQLANPAKAQVWQLQSPGHSYLYMIEYEGKNRSPKICGVASDQLKITPAINARSRSTWASRSIIEAMTTIWYGV